MVGLVVAVVVLGGAALADAAMRARVEAGIAAELRDGGVAGADVLIPGWPFLTQVAGGRFDRLDVTGDQVAAVPGLTDLRATLTGVATTAPHTAETLTASARLGAEAIDLGDDLLVSVEDGAVVVGLRILDIQAVVAPRLDGELIALDVVELRVAGLAAAPEDLPLGLDAAFEGLAVPVPALPAGLRLTAVQARAGYLELSLAGSDVTLEDLAPQTGATDAGGG